jgi:CRP/FNR family cyclic AMP-dependent transcriptional regulator
MAHKDPINLPAGQKETIVKKYAKTFPKGERIFNEGDYGEEMFFINEGKVRIFKTVRDTDKSLAILGKGEFFGEMSVLDSKPRSASAETVEDSTLIVLDGKTFETILRGDPEVSMRLIRKLVKRLREADDQIENMMIKDDESKVIHTLLKLIPEIGMPTKTGIQLQINPQDLLTKIGIDTDSMKVILAKLKKFDLIRVSEKQIFVPSLSKLRRFNKFVEMKSEFTRK